MGSILTNGVFLPAEGERNCYEGLAANWVALDGMIGGYSSHAANLTIHVTAADKEAWNSKADASALTAHTGNTTIHVTAADKEAWNSKADASALTAHTGNTTIHVTAADKNKWDAVTSKANDADAVHKSGAETIGGLKTFSDTVTVPSINGINPGSLSMPDLTAGVDISGYITLGTYQQDTYTPPSDGYITIMIYGTSANGLFVYSGSFGTGMRSIGGHPTYGQVSVIFLPVRGGTTYTIENTGATNIGWAKFYPCQGNV